MLSSESGVDGLARKVCDREHTEQAAQENDIMLFQTIIEVDRSSNKGPRIHKSQRKPTNNRNRSVTKLAISPDLSSAVVGDPLPQSPIWASLVRNRPPNMVLFLFVF